MGILGLLSYIALVGLFLIMSWLFIQAKTVGTGSKEILNNPSIDNLTIGALLDIDLPYHFIKRIEEINAILGAQQIDNILTTLRFIENKKSSAKI